MNIPTLLIGRVLLAIPCLVLGLMHFPGAENMAGMVPAWMPGGVLWVYVTGVANILAGVAFITGKQARLAGQLTALMMFIFIFAVHLPGMSNPEMAQMSMIAILKDLGLAGGALLITHLASSK
jgi:uncharacterized membrane protein YphA (DoxX/SURF4 family)